MSNVSARCTRIMRKHSNACVTSRSSDTMTSLKAVVADPELR